MQPPETLLAFPNARCLRSSIHRESKHHEDFSTLGRRIIDKTASWGPNAKIYGDFEFIECYWEWTEDVLFHFSKKLQEAAVYDAVYASLYTYDHNKEVIRAFCEAWCPSTNTLHLSDGEASISLWDLHKLGGLPLHGAYYDEIIPCTAELTGPGFDKGKRYIPKSCEYLFAAFYFLKSSDDGVSISSWINFWFEGKSRYSKPPARKVRRSRLVETYNPDGVLWEHQERTKAGNKAFATLGISDSCLSRESYLAAFLSCWICAFVLPGKDSLIRPETFKTAALMAFGTCVNLAVPVLVNIYHGLNQISQSVQAGFSGACFPLHYVTGWLSFYFKTHYTNPKDVSGPSMVKYSGEGRAKNFKDVEARKLIYNAIEWNAVSYLRNRDEVLLDDKHIHHSDLNFFVSIRSHFLPTRCKQVIMVEPYSPHRFGRQFGFCQDVPGALKNDKRTGSYDDLYKLWILCTRTHTNSTLAVPARSFKIGEQVTPRYAAWWTKVHDAYFEHSIDALVSSARASALKRKKASNDVVEPEHVGGKNKASTHSGSKEKQAPSSKVIAPSTPLSVDVCEVEVTKEKQLTPSVDSSEGSDHERHWKRQKTRKVPDDGRSSIQSGASNQLETGDVQIINDDQEVISPDVDTVQASTVEKPFVEASKSTNSESSQFSADDLITRSQIQLATTLWESIQQKIVQVTFDEAPTLLGEVRKVLDVIATIKCVDSSSLRSMVEDYFANIKKFKHLDSFISSHMSLHDQTKKVEALTVQLEEATSLEHRAVSNVNSLHSNMADVEKEITSLQIKMRELESSIENTEADLENKKAITSNLRKEINLVKSSPTYSESDARSMDSLKSNLATTRRDLETFRWKI